MENTNLNLRIKRLPYSRLLKSEMADYVEKTIDVVDSHDHDSGLINPMFERLSAKTTDIQLLRLNYGIDTQRLKVAKLKSDMMLIISSFKLKVRMLTKSNPELSLHMIENAINKHLRHLNKCENDKKLIQKIAGFFDLVNNNEEFEALLAEFNLEPEVAAMKSIFRAVDTAIKKRVTMLSQRPNISTEVLVKGMSEAVDNLFQSIEVANMLSVVSDAPEDGEQLELAPLIEELNQLADMYTRSIAIRDANNKRKAKGKEGEDGGDQGEEQEGDEPIVTAMCYGGDANDDEGVRSYIDADDAEEPDEDVELFE